MNDLNLAYILKLYEKYKHELKVVRKAQRWLFQKILGEIEDVEAEITYLLIREEKPLVVVEASPKKGYSTGWILAALRNNQQGKLFSFDLINDAQETFKNSLIAKNYWQFFKGDIKDNLDKIPNKINHLFMDSDHSGDFAQWYIKNLFPKVEPKGIIQVHDIFYKQHPFLETSFNSLERKVIIDWIFKKKINYFGPATKGDCFALDTIKIKRTEIGITDDISHANDNAMIFFRKL